MDLNSDYAEILKKIDEYLDSDEKITDLGLEIKTEIIEEGGNIKAEVFEETNNSEPLLITGEKRKNEDRSNLKNKKIKEEFVVFVEESDYKQEPQEIEELHLDNFDNQVIKML